MSRLFSGFAGTIAKGALLLGGSAFLLDSCIYNVDAGHRGIIFDRLAGVKDVVKGEGTHFIVPILQRPIIMEVRTQPRTISTVTGTKDLQKVNLSLRVLSRPNVAKLPQVYKQLGTDFAERILPSIGNEVLKAVVAQYNADQLLTLRDQVSREIRESLNERAKGFNLVLDDVSITHLNFSKDFSRAIEDKQVAEQMAERAKFMVAKSEQEKQALIIRSQGDAEAAQLVSDAMVRSGKGLLELRRIETAIHIAQTLGRGRNITYLPSGNNMLLNLPAQR
jgi:prohibitin 1